MVKADASTSVWRLVDGKPGHDRQTAGLAAALAERTPVVTTTFDVRANPVRLSHYLRATIPFGADVAPPDLIIGAGRACQWPMLATRRARGGRTVYLMKPAWPIACFDLCLIPDHDAPPDRPDVLVTDGVLNDVTVPAGNAEVGLVLVGGPSAHYAWDEAALLRQVQAIIGSAPAGRWVIADSRRTPATTRTALAALANSSVQFVSAENTDGEWLAGEFGRARTIWVSRDSVSMIYEALAARAPIGLLDVPTARDSRITRLADQLAARGMLTTFADWAAGAPLATHEPLREAARCADIIIARLCDRPGP